MDFSAARVTASEVLSSTTIGSASLPTAMSTAKTANMAVANCSAS